jgi:F0F1-type ATP synthase membrane subunit c/vacuolar-type H+-ATPase subunit K
VVNTILIIGVTVLSQGFAAAYVYGKLTQSVTDQRKQTDKLETKVDGHETRISHLEGAHI